MHLAARSGFAALFTAVALLISSFAQADLVGNISLIRARGCSEGEGTKTPLRKSAALDDVAQAWSRGGRLQAALTRSKYRATHSTSMHISGSRDDGAIATVLMKSYCKEVIDPQFQDIGIYRRRDEVWIVLAAPFSTPAIGDAATVRRRVLELVNQARSQQRKCGNRTFSPVPPLTASAMLDKAALVHASDMAKNNWFEHQGTDGSTPAQRAERAGYRWRTVGENIAAGASTADEVVKGWLNSPGHCVNIMNGQFAQMGIAYFVNDRSDSGIYWSQVFATPR